MKDKLDREIKTGDYIVYRTVAYGGDFKFGKVLEVFPTQVKVKGLRGYDWGSGYLQKVCTLDYPSRIVIVPEAEIPEKILKRFEK